MSKNLYFEQLRAKWLKNIKKKFGRDLTFSFLPNKKMVSVSCARIFKNSSILTSPPNYIIGTLTFPEIMLGNIEIEAFTSFCVIPV